jgi:hypothetical protein
LSIVQHRFLATAALAWAFLTVSPAGAEVLTFEAYRQASALGGRPAAEAGQYVKGALHGILVVGDALEEAGNPIFCTEGTGEGEVDVEAIPAEFRAWLEETAPSETVTGEMKQAPIALFVLGFLGVRFPCAADGEKGGAENKDLDSVLRRTLPQ